MFAGVTGATAASATDFYLTLLRRGIAEFDAARYDNALNQLRIAAFGLMDNSDRYQIAHVYQAVAADRLGRAEDARSAAQRVVAAERVQKTFGTLTLPSPVRSDFETVAKKVLTAAEVAAISGPPAVAAPPAQTTRPAPAPVQEKPQVKPAVESGGPAAAVQTKPKATTPAPKPAPVQASATVLANGEQALKAGDLAGAQRTYRDLLSRTLSHAEALRVAEGLYRARDFAGVLLAFVKAGALARGEEPYRYYRAVAYYETGQFANAKKELAAVLPFIQITADVAVYRRKIESAR